MNLTELNACLEELRHGGSNQKMQFNFLFAAVSGADTTGKPHYTSLHFGKYQSRRAHATPFYKPYSKPVDLNLIAPDESSDL